MNHSPTSNLATGKRYWRSLDELADTPEFKDWLHREFPVGASEMVEDGQSRRNFLKIMSASFAFAGIATLGAGCRRPEEKLTHHSANSRRITRLARRNILRPPCPRAPARFRWSSNLTKAGR